jgi:RNA polymerase sigma-70 factor, ECF subfamily
MISSSDWARKSRAKFDSRKVKPLDDIVHLKDYELVNAAQRGEPSAFRELVTRYEAKVYHLALKMLRDEQDAEDVLQETFINVYRHLDTFRGDSEFSTWVYRIATNASLMKIRSRRPMSSLDEPTDDTDSDSPPRDLMDWSFTPEEALMNGETRSQMDKALTTLPETLRSVFVLRDIEGLSVEETARVLDISIPNVKTRLHRARLALRDELASYFAERKMVRKDI